MAIHPSAVVHPDAEVHATASVGPFCVVGPDVTIGPYTRLLSHVVVDNHTTVGARNVLHPFCVMGGAPQDKKYAGEPARLIVGDDNVFRENTTLNIGTRGGHMQTRLGNDCLMMAGSHVAHDCIVGHGVIMANGVALAGHVELHDGAILGGLVAVHQFCRVGRQAFIGGGAMVAQDVPPFCVAQGDRATLAGINVVGLRRAGFDRAAIARVHRAFRQLFFGAHETREQALAHTETVLAPHSDLVDELCRFVRAASRGVCGPRHPSAPGAAASDGQERPQTHVAH